MNFLAHLHLSSGYPSEMVGNFIGDYVKGKQYQNFDENISKGIVIHRLIDSYTDDHPLTKECKAIFQPIYGKYAGIIVDMVFDYCLASNWSKYSPQGLENFSNTCYNTLFDYYDILPPRVQSFLPKMKAIGRLQSYATETGILNAIKLMSQYTSLPDKSEKISPIFHSESEKINQMFEQFYPEIRNYVGSVRTQLKLT